MKPIQHYNDPRCICKPCPEGVDDMFWMEDEEASCEEFNSRKNPIKPKPKQFYNFKSIKTPSLIPIDLSKCCHCKGDGLKESAETCHYHPDIDLKKSYLAPQI